MLSPRCSKSSPVLATTSSSLAGRIRLRPSASLAPPTPPDSATTSRLLIGTCPLQPGAPVPTQHCRDRATSDRALSRQAGLPHLAPTRATLPHRSLAHPR